MAEKRFRRAGIKAQGMTEYVLVLVLCTVFALASVSRFSASLKTVYDKGISWRTGWKGMAP